ncbi:peptidylprolyl isomerase [Flammeovirgaceae bacterium SG7u.111]|nr:peptidylprolyl isomerase [Flammeovirgaceae bacterium SG7u.132]WPO34750.1 peptidylprolyl isomerase [Flammeovirgaceae bacterium SG7u.111]
MNFNYLKLPIYLLLISLFTFSCSEQKNKEEKKTKAKVEEKKKAKAAEKFIKLDNSNAAAFLEEYGKKNKETILLLKTSKGDMKIRLYENTPLHRANFLMLSKRKYFNKTQFYRVIKNFMVQAGDSDDRELGRVKKNIGKYQIPAEFRAGNFHKKGALALAREYEQNPEKKSSSFDFYIVQGEKYNKQSLEALEMENNITFSPEQVQIYTTLGGTPHLDGEHTVFGEVIEGLSVIDSIAAVEVSAEDNWPVDEVNILDVVVLQ